MESASESSTRAVETVAEPDKSFPKLARTAGEKLFKTVQTGELIPIKVAEWRWLLRGVFWGGPLK